MAKKKSMSEEVFECERAFDLMMVFYAENGEWVKNDGDFEYTVTTPLDFVYLFKAFHHMMCELKYIKGVE